LKATAMRETRIDY